MAYLAVPVIIVEGKIIIWEVCTCFFFIVVNVMIPNEFYGYKTVWQVLFHVYIYYMQYASSIIKLIFFVLSTKCVYI